LDEVVRLAFDLCAGLDAIHTQLKAVHRDIKPSNILFGTDGVAKIGDLGLAQVPGGPSMRSKLGSMSDYHPGTPEYMSPEQEHTKGYLFSSSDIYSLGCVLFEALSGDIYKLVYGTHVREHRPEIPGWLDIIIARSLLEQAGRTPEDDGNPNKRYRLIGLLKERLELGWQGEIARRQEEERLQELYAQVEEQISHDPNKALELIKQLYSQMEPGIILEPLDNLREKTIREQETRARLKAVFQQAESHIEKDPARSLLLLSQIKSEKEDYPGLEGLRSRAVQVIQSRQRQAQLAGLFLKANRLVNENPGETLELVKQIEKQEPEYKHLGALRSRAEKILRENEKGARLQEWFNRAEGLIPDKPGEALELIRKIHQNEPWRYPGLGELRRRAKAALEDELQQSEHETLFAKAQGLLERDPHLAIKLLTQIQTEAPEYPGLNEVMQRADREMRSKQLQDMLAEQYAQAEARLLQDPGSASKILDRIESEDSNYPGLADLRSRIEESIREGERNNRLAKQFMRAKRLQSSNPQQTLHLVAQISQEAPGYPGLEKLNQRAKSTIERRRAKEAQKAFEYPDWLPWAGGGLLILLLVGWLATRPYLPGKQGTALLTPQISGAAAVIAAATTTPAKSKAPKASLTPAPSNTPLPSLTPTYTTTPTPDLPVREGTSLPNALAAISVKNAGELAQIAHWGTGNNQVLFSQNGPWLAVLVPTGIYLYKDMGSAESRGYMWQTISSDRTGSSMSFTSDGETLAIGFENGDIQLWGISSITLKNTFAGHSAPVKSMAFSSDDRLLVSGSGDQTIRIWDVMNGSLLREIETKSAVNSLAVSPDGKTLAVGTSDGNVEIRQSSNWELLHKLGEHNKDPYIAFSPDSKILAVGSHDNVIRMWQVDTGYLLHTLEGHKMPVVSVVFSPDGQYLASGSQDESIRLWKAKNGEFLATFYQHFESIESLSFSTDSLHLASISSEGRESFWYIPDRSLLQAFAPPDNFRHILTFTDKSDALESADSNGVRIWRIADGGLIKTIGGDNPAELPLAFSADGKIIAAGIDQGHIRSSQVEDGSKLFDVYSPGVICAAFSPDSKLLATGSTDGDIILIRSADGISVGSFAGSPDPVTSLVFSPDGKFLASGDNDGHVQVKDLENNSTLHDFPDLHHTLVSSLAFSPDGDLLATGSDDQTVQILDMASGDISSGDQSIYLYHNAPVSSIAFSPDGLLLATYQMNGYIKVFDVSSGQQLKILAGWRNDEHLDNGQLAFSPDGRLLALASLNGSLRLWGVSQE